MNLKPGEEIGEEVHDLDQFIRFEEGEGTVVLDGQKHPVLVAPSSPRYEGNVGQAPGKRLEKGR